MKICKYCGSEVPDNAAFCPSCGKRVNADPAQQNGRRYEDVHDVPKRSWGALASVAGIALALLLCVVVFFAFINLPRSANLKIFSSRFNLLLREVS